MLDLLATLLLAAAAPAELRVPMALATSEGPGASVGEVRVRETSGGLAFATDLHDLPPGPHGFHVHVAATCAPGRNAAGEPVPAGAAGGHLDPGMTNVHLGPYGPGHLGALPRVEVDAAGRAKAVLVAPRITSLAQVRGHALMLHVGGDNYADAPAALGGGGARLACGVIPD